MTDKASILVVDDSSELLELLVRILTTAGYDVRPADSGELALEAVAANPPDLILLDIHMPDMDGLEVCRRLKARQATRHIPVIFISATTDIQETVTGLQLGAADYIPKPFQVEELLARIQTHLALSQANAALGQQADGLRLSLDRAERSRRAMLSALEDQKQTEDTLRQQNQILSALQNTTLELASQLDLKTLLENIVRRACALVGTSAGLLDLVDPVTNQLMPQIGVGALEESLHLPPVQPGEGLAGTIWQTGEMLVVPDYDQWPGRLGGFSHGTLGSVIGVPLLSGADVVIGVLITGSAYGVPQHFDPGAVELLNQFARLATVAVQNARLFSNLQAELAERVQAEDKIRQRAAELEMLYQSGLALNQLLSPKEIGQKIIELLEQKMDWHHTTIRLYHPQNETLELLAFNQPNLKGEQERSQAKEHFDSIISRPDQGLSGWVVLNSQIVRSGDVNHDPRYAESYPGLHSGLYVPVKSDEHMLGVISIESEVPNAFDEADERLVATLANQAAVAFENARLYQTAQQEIIERKKVEALLADEKNQLAQRVEERTADLSRANIHLERAMRVKDEFLASMSHELRTPLTGILGLSEVLQLKTYGELNEKQGKTLKIIEESGQHLLDLINDILELSKIEAGKLELQFAPCSLADICRASLQLIKGMAQHKNQLVHYSAPARPVMIRADARRLKQILVNLLSNAVKFTPENGELGLEIHADESERNIQLIVWDKGIGIQAEDLHKLFTPFTQIDSRLAREYSGTGLGLSLVQRLTKLHNGRVEVESAPGAGSRFTVILPWSSHDTIPIPYLPHPHTAAGAAPLVSEERSNLRSILIADDNEVVLQMLADFLETKSYRVVKTHSGAELLEQAAELHPAVMLVDIQMPGMDGLETIRRIRSHPDPLVAAAPVIAVTALVMPGDRQRCLQAGANDYISKPLKLQELDAIIRKQIGKNNERTHLYDPGH